MYYIGGVKLNETECQVKRLIERFIDQDDVSSARAARAIFSNEQSKIRFSWKQMVMGDNA